MVTLSGGNAREDFPGYTWYRQKRKMDVALTDEDFELEVYASFISLALLQTVEKSKKRGGNQNKQCNLANFLVVSSGQFLPE